MLGLVADAFSPKTRGQGQADLCYLEASLVYKMSSKQDNTALTPCLSTILGLFFQLLFFFFFNFLLRILQLLYWMHGPVLPDPASKLSYMISPASTSPFHLLLSFGVLTSFFFIV